MSVHCDTSIKPQFTETVKCFSKKRLGLTHALHTRADFPPHPKGWGLQSVNFDDLLATGGTLAASVELIEKLEGDVVSIAVLIELLSLKGREKLRDYDIFSLIQY